MKKEETWKTEVRSSSPEHLLEGNHGAINPKLPWQGTLVWGTEYMANTVLAMLSKQAIQVVLELLLKT